MLQRLLILFCLVAALPVIAQQKISNSDLKVAYEVPATWEVKEYFKGDWDKPSGSAICHCGMTINIFKMPNNLDDFDYIHMVVYPSDKKGFTNPMRSQVWQYEIKTGNNGDSLKTPNLQWKHFTGKITTSGENRFKECIVWKYTTNTPNQKVFYTVYFWGKPAMMNQYKGTIEKIMNGFKSI
ncbi:MAG: hypothetical protein ACXVPN_14370 [Bacteroidia bacterium]